MVELLLFIIALPIILVIVHILWVSVTGWFFLIREARAERRWQREQKCAERLKAR